MVISKNVINFFVKVKGIKESKNFKEAATYIPNSDRVSIIGDGRLDFQVRNGAGYDPPSSPTTKRDKNTDVCLSLFAFGKLEIT